MHTNMHLCIYIYIWLPLCVVLLVIQELWDRAEALSDASGHAYTDRHGVRRNTHAEIIGLAKTVLSQWGSKHGVDFNLFADD